MEQFAIGANLESAAARGNQRKRLDALAELENFGRQTDGLRRVVSNDAIFDRDFGLHRQTPFRQRSYRCDERWSRNAQEWWRCARRALQRSRRLTQASLQLKKCSRSPLHTGCGISTSVNRGNSRGFSPEGVTPEILRRRYSGRYGTFRNYFSAHQSRQNSSR